MMENFHGQIVGSLTEPGWPSIRPAFCLCRV